MYENIVDRRTVMDTALFNSPVKDKQELYIYYKELFNKNNPRGITTAVAP
jgi:hypothetical protein